MLMPLDFSHTYWNKLCFIFSRLLKVKLIENFRFTKTSQKNFEKLKHVIQYNAEMPLKS